MGCCGLLCGCSNLREPGVQPSLSTDIAIGSTQQGPAIKEESVISSDVSPSTTDVGLINGSHEEINDSEVGTVDSAQYSKPVDQDIWVLLVDGSELKYNLPEYEKRLERIKGWSKDTEYTYMDISNGGTIHKEVWDNVLKEIVLSFLPEERTSLIDFMSENDFKISKEVWDGTLRNLTMSLPLEKRMAFVKFLSRCTFTFDRVDKILRFSQKDIGLKTQLSIYGTIAKDGRISPYLKILYSADKWLFVKDARIVIDNAYDEWLSNIYPKLDFKRDNSSFIWEYINLNLSSRKIYELTTSIANSTESIIRFYGSQYYSDFEVPIDMKNAMKDILEGIQVLGFLIPQ